MALPSPGSRKSWTLTSSGLPLGCHSRPPFLNCPTSSFFFVSTEITGWPRCWNRSTLALMNSNCTLRSGCEAPSRGLAVTLHAVARFVEQATYRARADGMMHARQLIRQQRRTLACPPQRGLGITARRRLDQTLQRMQQVRVAFRTLLASGALATQPGFDR